MNENDNKTNRKSGNIADWINEQKKHKEQHGRGKDEADNIWPPEPVKRKVAENMKNQRTETMQVHSHDKEDKKTPINNRQDVADNIGLPTQIDGLPQGIYAHFLLTNISGLGRKKGIPRYMKLEKTKTLIGKYASAHIRLDDEDTIEIKHAKIIFEDTGGKKDFVIYPINNASLSVNGSTVSDSGIVLHSGDTVEIGSAELIFFYKDIKRNLS